MKKYYLIFLVLFTAVLLFTSCGKKDETPAGSQNVNLIYKFEKGNKFRYKLTTILNTDESIKADSLMQVKSNQNDTYIVDFEVLDVDTDKIAELNATITSMNISVDNNGQQLSFDPSKTPSKEEEQNFWQYAIQYNIPFRARINRYGEVIEVSRLEKMIDKLVSLQPQQQTVTPEQKVKISRDLAEQIVRPFTQLIFRQLPQKTLGKDSTWEKNYTSQMAVFKTNNTATYKVEDFIKLNDDNAVKVSINLTSIPEGENKGEQNGVKYNFEDPKLSGNGSIIFNIDKGLLAKSETQTTVELVANLESKNTLQKTVKSVRRDLSTNKNIVELLPL